MFTTLIHLQQRFFLWRWLWIVDGNCHAVCITPTFGALGVLYSSIEISSVLPISGLARFTSKWPGSDQAMPPPGGPLCAHRSGLRRRAKASERRAATSEELRRKGLTNVHKRARADEIRRFITTPRCLCCRCQAFEAPRRGPREGVSSKNGRGWGSVMREIGALI